MLVNVSLHSLARRYQRGREADDAVIMRDMNVAANADLPVLADGGGAVKVTTYEDGGRWRGRLGMIEDGNGRTHRIIAVRT